MGVHADLLGLGEGIPPVSELVCVLPAGSAAQCSISEAGPPVVTNQFEEAQSSARFDPSQARKTLPDRSEIGLTLFTYVKSYRQVSQAPQPADAGRHASLASAPTAGLPRRDAGAGCGCRLPADSLRPRAGR